MAKMQRSVGLSPDVVEFVEEHRGVFSFSAFAEYLIREGIALVTDERSEDERDARKRKAVIRVR